MRYVGKKMVRRVTGKLVIAFCLLLMLGSHLLSARPLLDGHWPSATRAEQPSKIGIICGHPKEVEAIAELMGEPLTVAETGRRCYVSGRLHECDMVFSCSRPGKVAAAAVATYMIVGEGCNLILVVGVCGGLPSHLCQGDAILATSLLQHDLDSSPLTPPCVIPILNVRDLYPDLALRECALSALYPLFAGNASLYLGEIISGDRFVSTTEEKEALLSRFPSALGVDMESAAVGQVCFEYGVPLVVMRLVSDDADAWAASGCMRFIYEEGPITIAAMVDAVVAAYN